MELNIGSATMKKLPKESVAKSKVIAIMNHKGGCGKTAISEALSHFLNEEKDVQILTIDNDPQMNYTQRVGISSDTDLSDRRTDELYRTLTKTNYMSKIDALPVQIIYPNSFKCGGSLSLIAGSPECELYASTARQSLGFGECVQRFTNIINFYKEYYNYIIIDTAPSIHDNAINEMVVNIADVIIIPFDGSESVLGLNQFMTWLRKAAVMKKQSPIFVLTKYQPDTIDIRRSMGTIGRKFQAEDRNCVYRAMKSILGTHVCDHGIQERKIYKSHTYHGLMPFQRKKYRDLCVETMRKINSDRPNSMDFWFNNDISSKLKSALAPIEAGRNRGQVPNFCNIHFRRTRMIVEGDVEC